MAKYRFRTWRCEDCKTYFRSMDPDPVCPHCTEAGVAGPQHTTLDLPPDRASELPAPAYLSEHTKNVDGIARGLMAANGMTNMRDNQKPGDISAPPLTHDQIKIANMNKTGFWQGGSPAAAAGSFVQDGHHGVPKDHAMKTLQGMIKAKGY